MGSTFGGIELGKRALIAQQTAMTTTGQNIANVNTEGYTRQRAVMKTTYSIPGPSAYRDVSPGQLGTGVEINKITRLRDEFVDRQFYRSNSELGKWESTTSTLRQIEDILSEPSETGLQDVLNQFHDAWNKLANDPDNPSMQKLVMEQGKSVTEAFRQISDSLQNIKNDLGADPTRTDSVVAMKVDEVNQYAKQISDLNEKISRVTKLGNTPTDLLDERNLLLDKLSKLVNISVSTNGTDSSMIDVKVGERGLVTGTTPTEVTDAANFVLSADVTGGELKGIQDMIKPGGKIDEYAGLVDQMKAELSSNYTVGQTSFFNYQQPSTGTSSPITINTGFFSEITSSEITKIDHTNLDQLHRTLIAQIGTEKKEADRFETNAKMTVDSVEARRQSVMGVSIDEEMTDMLKYQHAYNAAARVITVMDEMLDKLINGTGRI